MRPFPLGTWHADCPDARDLIECYVCMVATRQFGRSEPFPRVSPSKLPYRWDEKVDPRSRIALSYQ
jgi:hypothetical protein